MKEQVVGKADVFVDTSGRIWSDCDASQVADMSEDCMNDSIDNG